MRWSLQAKMFVVFALVATLPLLAMSYLAVTQTQEAFKEEVGRSNEQNAATAAAFVDAVVQSAIDHVNTEAQISSLRDGLATEDRGALLLELRNFRERTADGTAPLFTNVILLNASGVVLAAFPQNAAVIGADAANSSAHVRAAFAANATRLPIEGPADAPTLPIVTPVFIQGKNQGTLLASMSFQGIRTSLGQLTPRPGENVALADETGRLLVHDDLGKRDVSGWAGALPLQRARTGTTGFTEFRDPLSGERSLAGYAPVGKLQWTLAAYESIAVAYEELGRLTAVLVVLAADLLVAMLLASILVAHAVAKPIRRLTEAADAMAQGRLGTRIDIGGNDEISDLAATFNVMAERIAGNVEQARRSEERYRGLIESANDLIFTVEPDGRIAFASALSERILGRKPTEIIGAPAAAWLHPEDQSVFATATSSVFTTGRALLDVQYRILQPDGEERILVTNLSPVMTGLGVPGRVLGVSRDVTDERKRERLRETSFEMARVVSEKADLQPLMATALEIMLGAAGVESGAAFARKPEGGLNLVALQGVKAAGRIDWQAFDPLMPHPDEPLQEVHERSASAALREHGYGITFTIPLIERAETLGLIVLLAPAHAQLDLEKRQALGALGAQLAVGIRRSQFEAKLRGYASELESKVEERTAMLVEKSQEMESFLYTVSHDLKAPLISIEGYAQGLEEDHGTTLDDEARHYLERIRKNAELMESLITDLLEFSRIGRVEPTRTEVDTRAILHDVHARLGHAFEKEGGALLIDPDTPTIPGEPKRIAQLFQNLVGNALKYRHPERPPRAHVTSRKEGNEVIFTIQDNGRGMPPQAREKAFQIFQRFPNQNMPDPGGTGMGLAIVKRIAESHGGRVWYNPVATGGTAFHIALPLDGPSAPQAPSTGGVAI